MLVKTWKSLNSRSFESRKCRTPLSNACLAYVSNLCQYVTSKPYNWRLRKWRMLSLGEDYPSSRCSNKNLCFDKKFMAGRWNVSLLMIKVSTVLDTNKQGFWTISTEMGTHWGPEDCAIYGYSVLINVLSVHPRHLTGSCFEDGCPFYNPRSTEGKVSALQVWSLYYHQGFNTGNCPWPQIFLFHIFQDLGCSI